MCASSSFLTAPSTPCSTRSCRSSRHALNQCSFPSLNRVEFKYEEQGRTEDAPRCRRRAPGVPHITHQCYTHVSACLHACMHANAVVVVAAAAAAAVAVVQGYCALSSIFFFLALTLSRKLARSLARSLSLNPFTFVSFDPNSFNSLAPLSKCAPPQCESPKRRPRVRGNFLPLSASSHCPPPFPHVSAARPATTTTTTRLLRDVGRGLARSSVQNQNKREKVEKNVVLVGR